VRPDLIRSAVEGCLVASERQDSGSRLARADQGEADRLIARIENFLAEQSWSSA
jgi:hypothetical protein